MRTTIKINLYLKTLNSKKKPDKESLKSYINGIINSFVWYFEAVNEQHIGHNTDMVTLINQTRTKHSKL